jgi:hypothetical protein
MGQGIPNTRERVCQDLDLHLHIIAQVFHALSTFSHLSTFAKYKLDYSPAEHTTRPISEHPGIRSRANI